MAKAAAAAPVQPPERLDTSLDRRLHVPWVSDVESHGHNRLAVSGDQVPNPIQVPGCRDDGTASANGGLRESTSEPRPAPVITQVRCLAVALLRPGLSGIADDGVSRPRQLAVPEQPTTSLAHHLVYIFSGTKSQGPSPIRSNSTRSLST